MKSQPSNFPLKFMFLLKLKEIELEGWGLGGGVESLCAIID